jgi:isoprenylcysteine carboxyl methyltransferase (ICMT) family protein YpbQ
MIYLIFLSFLFLRLVSLFISIRNEKRIKKQGAVEYGKMNSLLLTLVHILYYGASLYEAYISHSVFDNISLIGVLILIFSYVILFYVIYELREVWTVKIYILPNRKIVKSFLFRTVKHPNYFLNIMPELIGIGLLCHSWKTMFIGLPIYTLVLAIRIYQEENVMRKI